VLRAANEANAGIVRKARNKTRWSDLWDAIDAMQKHDLLVWPVPYWSTRGAMTSIVSYTLKRHYKDCKILVKPWFKTFYFICVTPKPKDKTDATLGIRR